MHSLRPFWDLQELRVGTRRADNAACLALSEYKGLSQSLTTLVIEDSHALLYSPLELAEFLRGYPRLRVVHLNPAPSTDSPHVEYLPGVECLETLVNRRTVKEFGGLLMLHAKAPLPQKVHRVNTLSVLRLGRSKLRTSQVANRTYIRSLFPRVLVKAEDTAVAAI
jgi:hypothetical protein